MTMAMAMAMATAMAMAMAQEKDGLQIERGKANESREAESAGDRWAPGQKLGNKTQELVGG